MRRCLTRSNLIAALLLLAAGVVIAGDAFVATNDARLRNAPRNFGARTVAELTVNERLEILEGDVGNPGWVKARTRSGSEGWLDGTALRGEPLESAPGAVSPNDRRYAESVGAAAKGWNSQIEGRARQDDASFDRAVRSLEAMIRFLDDTFRKREGGPPLHDDVEAFYAAGHFEPQPFDDNGPED